MASPKSTFRQSLPKPIDKEIAKKIDVLLDSIERVYPATGHMMWRSFIHGIFVGLGATVGVSLLLALVAFIVAQSKGVPYLRDIIQGSHIEQVLPDSTPTPTL